MKRLSPLLLLPLLAACAAPVAQREGQATPPGVFTSLFRGPEAEPPAPEPIPPQVLAALPPGVPPSVVQRGVDGCFLLAIEVTDPPSGYPLRDAAGNPVCEGGAAPVAMGEPGSLMPGNITPPAPLAPLNPG